LGICVLFQAIATASDGNHIGLIACRPGNIGKDLGGHIVIVGVAVADEQDGQSASVRQCGRAGLGRCLGCLGLRSLTATETGKAQKNGQDQANDFLHNDTSTLWIFPVYHNFPVFANKK
jgi:hypothetical protein